MRARTALAVALALAAVTTDGIARSRFLAREAIGGGVAAPSPPRAAVPLPALPLPAGARLMVVGDSLSAFNDSVFTAGANGASAGRPSGAAETAWSIDPRFNFDSWYDPADPWKRGLNGANQGIAGDHLETRTAANGNGIYPRTRYDLARGPQIVWLNAGTNTINSGDGGPLPGAGGNGIPVSAAYVTGRLDATIAQFTAHGVWVILSTLYPRGDWPDGDRRHRVLREVNQWIRAQAVRSGIVGVMDPYADLVAGPGDLDNVKPELFQEGAHGVHPNVAGGLLIGRDHLLPLIRSAIAPGSVFDQDPTVANLFPANTALLGGGTAGAKAGTAGMITGSVATGNVLYAYSPVAASIEDAGTYKRQVVAITLPEGSTGFNQIDFQTANVSAASIAAGAWLRAFVHIEANDPVSVAHIRMTMAMGSSSEPPLTVTANFEPSPSFLTASPGRGGFWIASRPFKALPNLTSITTRLTAFWPRGATYPPGTTVTIKFDRFILRAIPDPRPAWNLP